MDEKFQQLLQAARDGDESAINRLIEDCRHYLLMIANREMESGLGQKAGASDLVQDCMVSALRCLGGFEGDSREEWLGWLRGILLNDVKQTRRHYRTQGRDLERERAIDGGDSTNKRQEIEAGAQTPSSAAIATEEGQRLWDAMAALSEEDRQIIQLRNWDDLPFPEIAERMGRSHDAVRKLWSRAIVRLQKAMESQ